jgi:hypothetical protein
MLAASRGVRPPRSSRGTSAAPPGMMMTYFTWNLYRQGGVVSVLECAKGGGHGGWNRPVEVARGSPDGSPVQANLPGLAIGLGRDEILRRLDAAARRGKLAGFAARPDGDLFEVEAFSAPFDHVLIARLAEDRGPRLAFRVRMLRKMPLIFAIVFVLTVWPGLPLTHSMLVTYFSWYQWGAGITAAWYLPLTVLPVLWWLPGAVKKSRAEAAGAATEQIHRLRELLDGTLTQG